MWFILVPGEDHPPATKEELITTLVFCAIFLVVTILLTRN